MRGVYGTGQETDRARGDSRLLRLALQIVAQRAAVHPFQNQVRSFTALATVVHLHHVGMTDAGRHLRFDFEPCELLGSFVPIADNHLHGDRAIQVELAGLVDDSHSAAANLGQNLVSGNIRHSRAGLTDAAGILKSSRSVFRAPRPGLIGQRGRHVVRRRVPGLAGCLVGNRVRFDRNHGRLHGPGNGDGRVVRLRSGRRRCAGDRRGFGVWHGPPCVRAGRPCDESAPVRGKWE